MAFLIHRAALVFPMIVGSLAACFVTRPAFALGPQDLVGKWMVSGTQYVHVYRFDASGAAELQMQSEGIVVWSGSGRYTVGGNRLTIRLDATASDTPVQQVFVIVKLDDGALVLRSQRSYFADIPSLEVRFNRSIMGK